MADNSNIQGGESGRSSQNRLILAFGALILLALVGVIIALALTLNRGETVVYVERESNPEPEQRAVLITEDNLDEVMEEIEEPRPSRPAPASYETRMTTAWNFPDGNSPSTNAYVANAETNETPIYFDLQLASTRETIYASPVIPLGGELRNITLDTPLDAGMYPCVLVYHMLDENQVTLGTLSVSVNVTVEN